MRYYDLTLTDPVSGKVLREWSSFPGGTFDPGALNVIFDVPITVGSLPIGNPTITIEGISLADLTNAQQYAGIVDNGILQGGTILTLKGGMGKGLPLANPAQQGVLVQGAVFQSWGNWVGTDMTLSLLVIPSLYSYSTPGNIVFNWQQGQPLGTALNGTLATAFPGVPITITISDRRVASSADIGYYQTFNQLAEHIQQVTKGALSTSDQGVQMAYDQGQITIFDGTQQTSGKKLEIFDFIGQPTWIGYQQVQIKTVLRGDLKVGNTITFPQGYQSQPGAVQTLQSGAPYQGGASNRSAIQGQFQIQQIRHIGNFRDPDGGSWASIFNCVSLNA